MLQALALVAAVAAPPSPEQYYARALDTMNALPQPAYMTFDLAMKTSGAAVKVDCNPNAGTAFDIGWGKGMRHALDLQGEYVLQGNVGKIRTPGGTYCTDQVAIFKPAWPAMHDWMRYGIFDSPVPPQASADSKTTNAQSPAQMHTIASVTAVAPAAYTILDYGAALCPSGNPGHALHLIAKSDPDEHPLTDVIIETSSMRFCMMRFRLLSATVAGTGAKGDMTVNFGENGGYWSVTSGHAVIALRMIGVSLKHFVLDLAYSQWRYPAAVTAP